MPRSLLTFITAAVVLTAPLAGYAYERLPRSLADLSPADFSSQVRIADDPAAEVVVFSTREGYDRARGVKGARADDVHLRAVVDRRSGRANWQELAGLARARHRQRASGHHRGPLHGRRTAPDRKANESRPLARGMPAHGRGGNVQSVHPDRVRAARNCSRTRRAGTSPAASPPPRRRV
jgi:hypothetical protein